LAGRLCRPQPASISANLEVAPMTTDVSNDDIVRKHISTYTDMGWALVGIPAGSKAPSTFGWQQRATPVD
jgi:hypothetical protein